MRKKLKIFLLICSLKAITLGPVFSSDSKALSPSFLTEHDDNMQQPRVTGRVTDASTGEAMLAVTIVVKGTAIGQITDANGRFSLDVPSQDAVLVFSFIGFVTQEVNVTAGSNINVALVPVVHQMDEVVVVGYGVQKKETVVGSIAQASGDQIISSIRGADLTNALTGNLPGLITLQSSGIPGGSGAENPATQIFIRGQKTWNNSQPLILVDGIERDMNDVDPYTVEGISVLKDASATAVFGVKGANGVILITTRRGQVGLPKLTVNMSTTVKAVSRIADRLNSYETLRLKNYALLHEVSMSENSWQYMVPEQLLQYYKDQTYPDYLPDVDWKDEMLKDFSWDRNVNLSISGGTNFVKYFGSLSFLNEGDILKIQDLGQGYSPNFEYNRYNYRSNLDFTVTPTTTFSVNLSGYFSAQQRPRQGLIGKEWFSLYRYPPNLIPIRYSDGMYADVDDARWRSQFVEANFTGYQTVKNTQVTSDFQLVQKLDFITKGLNVKGKLSYDIAASSTGPNLIDNGIMTKYISKDIMNEITPGMTEAEIKEIEKKYTVYLMPSRATGNTGYDFVTEPISYTNETGNSGGDQGKFFRSLNYELSLNYNRDFGKHNVGGLFLMSRNERAKGSVFPSYREDWVGRTVYSYDKRYLFEFNAAYNGSEKFARKNRFGFFPSVALGWIVSNERFFENFTHIVNNLKFRFSNGKVGSDAGIARWLYTGSYNITGSRWMFGTPYLINSTVTQSSEGIIPNPDIQWETSEKTDIGVELALFNNRITFNLDYFWENRTNIFVSGDQRVVPAYFGAPAVAGNFGQVKNEGWEIETELSKTTAGGVRYSIGYSLSFAKDVVVKKSDPELAPAYQKQAGYAIGQPRDFRPGEMINTWNDVYTGVLGESNTFVSPGIHRLIDFNSNGIITVDDQIPYGYTLRPQYSYAPRFGLGYKGIDLNVEFYGVFNVQEMDLGDQEPFRYQQDILYDVQRDDAWSPELDITGDDATIRATTFLVSQGLGYAGYSRPRSYLRLKNVGLSYTMSPKFLKVAGISKVRCFINGENLFLWSEMLSDRETNASSSVYPMLKRATFGINLNF